MERMAAWKQLDRMKKPDEIFDLVCFGNFMAGQFNAKIPVDESRRAFARIKKLLSKTS